jgi:hypothetical protein
LLGAFGFPPTGLMLLSWAQLVDSVVPFMLGALCAAMSPDLVEDIDRESQVLRGKSVVSLARTGAFPDQACPSGGTLATHAEGRA